MTFRSRSQQQQLFLKHPDIAEEFSKETKKSDYSKLPEHVSKDKNGLKSYNKKHRRSRNGKEV